MDTITHRIKVIDSPPGYGKTSYAIQKIKNSSPEDKVIYITPYLDEVERIVSSCPEKEFHQPETRKGKGSKLRHFINLVEKGCNIVSTHALFSSIDDELIELLRVQEYTLYLDEVFQTVEKFNIIGGNLSRTAKEEITKQDIQTLISKNIIEVSKDDYSVIWVDDDKHLSQYEDIRQLANRNLLYFVNDCLLLWTFPIEVFREGIFKEIYIMTFQFDCQLQSYYYKYFELEYGRYNVWKNEATNKYEISEGETDISNWKKRIKEKLHIIDHPKLNKIGEIYFDARNHGYESALSMSWYEKNPKLLELLKNNLVNYFQNIMESKPNERLWTCFKEFQKKLTSKNVSKKYWLAINARATNDYIDKTVLAYLVNRYVDSFYIAFFAKKDVKVIAEEYALSEMIQWIFRSAIREEKDTWIYIPSQRMRKILIDYLDSE